MHACPNILPLRLDAVSYLVRGRRLIDRVSLTIDTGARVVILGPNGAGKSLLLRLCHGLILPSEGSVNWAGATVSGRKRHAMVFQRPVLLRRSARGNIVHALSLAGVRGRERQERADAALERFGLAALAGRSARVLSGGEQQRLALARASALRPEVLFLDEPTAALDPAATRAIESMVGTIHAEGVTVVMTTHDLGQARRVADEIVFLHGGRLIERAPAAVFFEGPQSREAQAFLKGELLW